MLRVKPADLKEGMIVAEPIIDVSGKVLLEAAACLTQANIELLRAWNVDFVCIRDHCDTGADLAQTVQDAGLQSVPPTPGGSLDQAVARMIGIHEAGILAILKGDFCSKAPDWAAECRCGPETGSLVTREGTRYYGRFLHTLHKLLEDDPKKKDFTIKEINEVGRIITDYVKLTPGVIAYTLRPPEFPCSELARHTLATAIVAGKLAMLLNYGSREIHNIVFAGLLHDIGFAGLPESAACLWHGAGAAEKRLYMSHIAQALSRLKGKSWVPKEVLLAVAQHHERPDGQGFPFGFTGEKIHPYAKIIAIADFFDDAVRGSSGAAMTLPEIAERLPFMHNRFDPVICQVFIAYLEDFLLSNYVELDDGRTGQIIYKHRTFGEPVILTSDGQFLDLNVCRDIRIERYSI